MRSSPEALQFASALTEKFSTMERPPAYTATAGRLYDRIWQCDSQGKPVNLHALVDRSTGHVYKPDGKRPALVARYPDVTTAVAAADPFGAYLYADAAPGVPGT